MPVFMVHGSHKRTGEDVAFPLTADSKSAAELEASRRGVLVEKVVPNSPPPAVTHVAPPVAKLLEDIDGRKSTADYATAAGWSGATMGDRNSSPQYLGLQRASWLLFIAGIICYVVAVVAPTIAAFNPDPNLSSAENIINLVARLLGLAIAGVLFQGAAAFLWAFRDLVRNSFR